MLSTDNLIQKRNALLVQRDNLNRQLLACTGAIMALDQMVKESTGSDEVAAEIALPEDEDVPDNVVEEISDWLDSPEGQQALEQFGYENSETWNDEEWQEEPDVGCSSAEGAPV